MEQQLAKATAQLRDAEGWKERALRAEAELKAESEAAEHGRHHKGEVEMQRKELARRSVQARQRNEAREACGRPLKWCAGVGGGAAGAGGHGDEDEEGEERCLERLQDEAMRSAAEEQRLRVNLVQESSKRHLGSLARRWRW